MKSQRSEEFERRLISFSIAIIDRLKNRIDLPPSVIDQIVRSSTSIGANYAEAQYAMSRADFRNKVGIAKKEAAETRYWLRLIETLKPTPEITILLRESQEILLIFQKVTSTLRQSSNSK